MRSLLLATTVGLATIGAAGGAFAQTAAPTAPPTAAQTAGAALNSQWGVGGLGAPPVTASTIVAPGVSAPGSFVVHLNGRINYYMAVEGDSANDVGASKNGNLEQQGYLRLYPGFDAVAANGLQYGVVGEIRSPGSNDTATGLTASGNSAANTLYWYYAYGYMGLPELGQLQFGQADGAFDDLGSVGQFTNFNDGAYDGDVPGFVTGAAAPVWPWPGVGNYQAVNRLVYLSPIWSGFQFGASFAPNNNALVNTENCVVAGPGCNRVISYPYDSNGSVGDSPKYNDIVDVAASYTGTFGPVGLNVGAGYLHSSPVTSSTPGTLAYNGISIGQAGATLSFAGFTVGGNILGGQMNNQYLLQPKGGASAVAFIFGGTYATGPIIVGASYFKYKFQGDFQSPTTEGVETDTGIAAGGTFALAPGLALYLSYLYGTRHQLGFDFVTGDPGTAYNNMKSQVFAVGTVVKW